MGGEVRLCGWYLRQGLPESWFISSSEIVWESHHGTRRDAQSCDEWVSSKFSASFLMA